MKLHFLFLLIGFCFELGGTFFLLEAKAIYFCVKVCPLYCSKREKRDAVPPYWDDDDDDTYISYHPYNHGRTYVYDEPPQYHRHHRFCHCDKTTTTTSTTTTTAKPEPTGICEFCNKKCGTPL